MKAISLLKVGIRKNRVPLVLLALVLFVLGSIMGGWSVMNPEKNLKTEMETNYEYNVNVTTQAEVITSTNLYEKGEVHTNLDPYQAKAFPIINISTGLEEETKLGENVSLEVAYVLSLKRNDREFWSNSLKRFLIYPGETETVELSMSPIRQKMNQIRKETDRKTQIHFEKQITLLNDGEVVETDTSRIKVTNRFTTINADSVTFKDQQEVIVGQTEYYSNYLYYGVILSVLGLLILLISVVIVRFTITEADYWEYGMYVNQEWISKGHYINRDIDSHLEMDSINDLKQVAIETDNRIVYDEHINSLIVIDDDVVYYKSHPDHDVQFF